MNGIPDEPTTPEESTPRGASAPSEGSSAPKSFPARHWKTGAGAALIAVVALVAFQAGGSADSAGVSPTDSATENEVSNGPDLARCVRLYNENGPLRASLAQHARVSDTYVEIAYAADYPDRCLITLDQPDRHVRRQVLEGSDGFPRHADRVEGGDAGDWNATISRDGHGYVELD